MRLLIVCVVLSLAVAAFGAPLEQVFSVVAQTQQAKLNAVLTLSKFATLARAPRTLTDATPTNGEDTDPCYQVLAPLGDKFKNDPNCQALGTVFAHSPLSNGTEDSINMFLDSLCKNPCFFSLFAVFKTFGECEKAHGANDTVVAGFATIEKALQFFCVKNPTNGKYCMSMLLNPTFLNITGNGRAPSNASICFGLSQFGCCLPPIFDFVDTAEASTVKMTIAQTCGFGLPPPCPKPGESVKLVKASWRITGLAYAYLQNNKERMGNALRKDIATALAIDQGYITISGFRQGSVIVDFDARGATDAATDALATKVATASKATTTTFPNTITEAGTDGVESGATVGFDTTTSSSTVSTYTAPGAGSHVQPMFALVAALVALAFFTRQ